MAIGIDDIDDELLNDDVEDTSYEDLNVQLQNYNFNEEEEEEDNTEGNEDDESQTNDDKEEDALTQYLRDNGIEDLNKIQFQNEEGEIEERAWKDLTVEELLNILRSNVREPEEGLDDEEIAFINSLRQSGITPYQYLEMLKELYNLAILQAYQQAAQEVLPQYSSSSLSDDELFILDLKARVPDITDEELKIALINAHENDELYQKLMKGIRAGYERLEQESYERDLALLQLALLQLYENYSQSIVNEIADLRNIGDLNINMDTDDMDELADFILAQDASGQNYFNKALQDPKTAVRAAWFALHGEDIFNGISDYYNKEIQKAAREGYLKGLAEKKKTLKSTPAVEIVPKKQNLKNVPKVKSIDDLDEDF